MHMFHMQGSRELVTLDRCLVRILATAQNITQDLLLLFTLGSDSVLHHLQHYDHKTNGVQLMKTTHVAQQENPLLCCNELIETMDGCVSILRDIKYFKDFTKKQRSQIDIVSILRCLKVSDTSLCNKRQLK